MAKYLVKIGFDNGDAESGPIVHTAEQLIEATSEKDAENQIDNQYGYGRDDSYCGCSVKLATDEEVARIEAEIKEADEWYQSAVDSGLINPEEDEAMWKQYEEDENRKDHLIQLADQVDNSSKIKWAINYDDNILIDTRDMSDEEVLNYMRGLLV